MNKSNTSFLTSLKGLCNRTFLLMLLIEALNNFATTTVKTPINVFGAALGASAVIIGLSSSLYNFTATATRPFSGFAMSRVNHKRWLQICMVLRMASFALFIVTNNVVVYVIAKCFQGLAYAAAATVIPAVIGSANSKAALGTAYGVYLAAPRIITSFAPSVSMYIYDNYGSTPTFLTGIGLTGVCLILTFFLNLPEDQARAAAPAPKKEKVPFSLRSIDRFICFSAFPVCLINLFGGLVYFANAEFLVLFGEEKGIANVAIFFTITNLISIWARLVGGAITDRFGTITIAVYLALMAMAPILIGSATSLTPIIVAAVVYQIGQGCLFPAILSLAVKMAPDEERALATSTFYFLLDFSGVIGSAVAGFLVQYLGYEMMYFCFAGFPVLGIIIYFLYRPTIKRTLAQFGAA